MRDRRLFAPFEINVPNVTINQRDDERRAQQDRRGAKVNSPRRLNAIHPQRDVKRQCQTKELIQKAEAHIRAPLQKSTNTERDNECADERDNS